MIGSPPRILDHTALIALFAAGDDEFIFALWARADRRETTLVFPAAAVAEASHQLGLDDDAWESLLLAQVTITGLGQAAAIGSALLAGSLVVRQVMYEAQRTSGVIVTRAPWQSPADGPPLRVI